MTFTPGSDGADGHRLNEAWGGIGNGSWVHTKLPDNTAVQASSVDAVAWLVRNVRGTLPQGYAATPYINMDNYNAEVHVLKGADAASVPYTPVYMVGSRSTATWAQKAVSMGQAGFRIPPGVLPSKNAQGVPDSDGTIVIYEPDYVWPGRPSDTGYHGRISSIWGAIDPDSNEAAGRERRWTCKYCGRMVGVNNYKPGHARDRLGTVDVNNTSNPDFMGPATSTSPAGTTGYPGFGREGVGQERNGMTTASMLPISHNQIMLRDLLATDPVDGHQGYIPHYVMFMLYPRATSIPAGTLVWPAMGYDGASTALVPHGSRFRLPAGYPIDPAWPWQKKMLVKMMRDYGIALGDTTGATGLSFRAETGSRPLWQFGGTGNPANATALMQSLPWEDLVKIAVGNDTTFNITTGAPVPDVIPQPVTFTPNGGVFNSPPIVTLTSVDSTSIRYTTSALPTRPDPAPGAILASGGSIATALANVPVGGTVYLDGTYTLTGSTLTLLDGKKLVRKPGAPMPTITGDVQIRLYGDDCELRGLKINQNGVAGKNIEVSCRRGAIIDCDLTNNFASGVTNDGAMVQTSPDGPAGVCEDFLAYGNFIHQIGNQGSTFQHAFYLRDVNRAVLHSNRFYQIHGGWAFHGYPNTKNVEITQNYLESGLFVTLWQDVAGANTNNKIHRNAWHNTYTGLPKPVVQGNTGATQGNLYDTNAGLNTNTAQGGSSGLDTNYTVTNNLVADPQFASPATGDFTIGNATVAAHIASPASPTSPTATTGILYTGPFQVLTSTIVKAIGVNGTGVSTVTQAAFEVIPNPVPDPDPPPPTQSKYPYSVGRLRGL